MGKLHYIIPIFVPHEGCPHNCVFCNQDSITGSARKVDKTFVQNTVEEYLTTLNKKDSVKEISFFGGTFTAISMEKQKELLAVAKKYKDEGKVSYIRLSTRPDYIDKDILKNLKDYSVDIIELGVQSLDEEVLHKSGRGHTVEDVEKASKLINEFGFTLGLQIMLGLPGDKFKKDIATVKRIIELKPSICRIYPSLVIKDTPMERMYIDGIYKPYSLEEAIDISKIAYGMLLSNDINVIRMGLQPTEEINYGKDLIAGPFHPAFRELVEGSLLNDMIQEVIYDNKLMNQINIFINSKDISKLYANKKKYFYDIKEQFNTTNIKVIQDNSIERGSVIINNGEICSKMSIYEYVTKKYKEGYFEGL